tara:strand:+ start:140 stop:493 length:354 start_codon:yes stop_codon:yes gene_type:complete
MDNNNLIIIDEKEIDELKQENKISESIINGYKNKVDKLKENNVYLNNSIETLRNKYDELEYKYKNLDKEKKNICKIHKSLYVDYTVVERENYELRKDIYDLEFKNRKLHKKIDDKFD